MIVGQYSFSTHYFCAWKVTSKIERREHFQFSGWLALAVRCQAMPRKNLDSATDMPSKLLSIFVFSVTNMYIKMPTEITSALVRICTTNRRLHHFHLIFFYSRVIKLIHFQAWGGSTTLAQILPDTHSGLAGRDTRQGPISGRHAQWVNNHFEWFDFILLFRSFVVWCTRLWLDCCCSLLTVHAHTYSHSLIRSPPVCWYGNRREHNTYYITASGGKRFGFLLLILRLRCLFGGVSLNEVLCVDSFEASVWIKCIRGYFHICAESGLSSTSSPTTTSSTVIIIIRVISCFHGISKRERQNEFPYMTASIKYCVCNVSSLRLGVRAIATSVMPPYTSIVRHSFFFLSSSSERFLSDERRYKNNNIENGSIKKWENIVIISVIVVEAIVGWDNRMDDEMMSARWMRKPTHCLRDFIT